MRSPILRIAFFGLLCASVTSAQQTDIPLTNWMVPPYRQGSSGGFTTMTDIGGPRVFIPTQPCRVVDTRGGGVFTGAYGGPLMAANATRPFDINSAPHCPGIPDGADAYSLNFTVTQTAGAPGDIRVWPTGNPPAQVTSVLNWTVPNATVANATVMPAGTSGSIDVTVAGTATHLLIDINGYFADALGNPANYLYLTNDNPGFATAFFQNAASANNSSGVYGFAGPSFLRPVYGAAGVRGDGITSGVIGVSQQEGVAGSLVDGAGNELAFGVLGFASTRNYGVYGQTYSTFNGAGVFGTDGTGLPADPASFGPAGVRGASLDATGVGGVSRSTGVSGVLYNSSGMLQANGRLGFLLAGVSYGLYSQGHVHIVGTLTGTNKQFVQPHPHDASKEIRYVSLEGPQSEVYFRGTAQVSRGLTRISVPEHFRFVADPATYSTLLTPVGAMATVGVLSQGPAGIVVQASRDVRIQYVVYAERQAVKNPDPISENVHFRPHPDVDFLGHLPESYRQLMIQNGTLNPDGTVNMETARRLGWGDGWEKRSRSEPQPVER